MNNIAHIVQSYAVFVGYKRCYQPTSCVDRWASQTNDRSVAILKTGGMCLNLYNISTWLATKASVLKKN